MSILRFNFTKCILTQRNFESTGKRLSSCYIPIVIISWARHIKLDTATWISVGNVWWVVSVGIVFDEHNAIKVALPGIVVPKCKTIIEHRLQLALTQTMSPCENSKTVK